MSAAGSLTVFANRCSVGHDLSCMQYKTGANLFCLQEMYEEYARAVQQAPGKAPRLRVFLFPGVEEALTPEQYQDGNAFFSEALENTWCATCRHCTALHMCSLSAAGQSLLRAAPGSTNRCSHVSSLHTELHQLLQLGRHSAYAGAAAGLRGQAAGSSRAAAGQGARVPWSRPTAGTAA